jgi:hypothetical protein
MAVTAKAYGPALAALAAGSINWGSDTIKIALASSAYTPDQDAHDFFNDVTNEVTGTGYTAGGITLASKTSTYTSGTNTQALDAADVTWSTSTITARYAVIYKSTGTSSTSPLIGYVDFGADVISSAGNFTITFDAAGIFTLSTS